VYGKYVENLFPYRLLWGREGGGSLPLLHSLAPNVILMYWPAQALHRIQRLVTSIIKIQPFCYCFRPGVLLFLPNDLNYQSKMPGGKCSFNERWFSMKEYSSWLAESSTIYSAKCKLLKISILRTWVNMD